VVNVNLQINGLSGLWALTNKIAHRVGLLRRQIIDDHDQPPNPLKRGGYDQAIRPAVRHCSKILRMLQRHHSWFARERATHCHCLPMSAVRGTPPSASVMAPNDVAPMRFFLTDGSAALPEDFFCLGVGRNERALCALNSPARFPYSTGYGAGLSDGGNTSLVAQGATRLLCLRCKHQPAKFQTSTVSYYL